MTGGSLFAEDPGPRPLAASVVLRRTESPVGVVMTGGEVIPDDGGIAGYATAGGDDTDGRGVGDAGPVCGWRQHAERLVAQLTDAGLLLDARWQDAVRNVPRHLLAPGLADPKVVTEQQLAAMYTDPTLLLDRLPTVPTFDGLTGQAPPSVLAWALDHLDGWDRPQRVLQVGVGRGYLTALLCFGVGDCHVVATEDDPVQAAATGETLAAFGWYPEIITGRPGWATAEHGRYDAVLTVEPAPGPDCMSDVQVGRERVACLSQLTPRGRLIVSGPSNAHATHPMATITRDPTGRLHCDIADPHNAIRAERLAVELLADDADLRALLLANHVADTDGCCRACAEDGDTVQPAPCRIQTITEAAARSAAACVPRAADVGSAP